jgi:hypothetical protein
MIGSLSLYSPGSIQSYGASSSPVATAQTLANDGSAVCASLDCGDHGAFNRATLQAQFPGLSLAAAAQARQTQQQSSGFGPKRQTGDAPASGGSPTLGSIATGGGRLASATLLTAQEAGQGGSAGAADSDLSEEEQAQVAKLKQIDAKVRAHERAHAAAGGAHAGAPSYSYTRGPDGQMYATAGEVAIDMSPESDPEATLQKAAQVAAAALAPADPSGQDRAVAAAAAQMRMQALAQIREEKRAEQEQQEAEASQARAEHEQAQAGGAGGSPAQTGPAQVQASQAFQQIGRLVGLVA